MGFAKYGGRKRDREYEPSDDSEDSDEEDAVEEMEIDLAANAEEDAKAKEAQKAAAAAASPKLSKLGVANAMTNRRKVFHIVKTAAFVTAAVAASSAGQQVAMTLPAMLATRCFISQLESGASRVIAATHD
jgi:predicted  nucleic acid-binding Zn-ribbon protein